MLNNILYAITNANRQQNNKNKLWIFRKFLFLLILLDYYEFMIILSDTQY